MIEDWDYHHLLADRDAAPPVSVLREGTAGSSSGHSIPLSHHPCHRNLHPRTGSDGYWSRPRDRMGCSDPGAVRYSMRNSRRLADLEWWLATTHSGTMVGLMNLGRAAIRSTQDEGFEIAIGMVFAGRVFVGWAMKVLLRDRWCSGRGSGNVRCPTLPRSLIMESGSRSRWRSGLRAAR